MKKKVFIGYTHKNISPCWTFMNTLNLTAIIQKTKPEALARYTEDSLSALNDVIKVKITIEQVS